MENQNNFNDHPALKQLLKPKKMRLKDYPVLMGIVSADGRTIRVYCPTCHKHHIHGWGPGEARKRGGVHRVAHCIPEVNPKDCGDLFTKNGYVVKEYSKTDRQRLFESLRDEFESNKQLPGSKR